MSFSLRVLILTPTAFPAITGNAMTVERWRFSLVEKGIRVEVLPTEGIDILTLVRAIRDFKPELIHVHHAFRAGAKLLDPLVEVSSGNIPLVVSPGGTDIHVDIKVKDRRRIIEKIFYRARFLLTQSKEISGHLKSLFPHLESRLVFIPKSILWHGDEFFDLREAGGCGHGTILFLLPAGIRPVKGNLECLQMLKKVYAARPCTRVIFAGAPIDPDYSAKFETEVNRLQVFARWIPPIHPRAIRSAYAGADVVLNASYSEGLSNALIEATAVGRPVLASKIPGNRWPVLGDDEDHPMGLLYDVDDPEDFLKKALILIDEEDMRNRLGGAGKRRGAILPTPQEEAGQLVHVYQMALEMG